MANEASIINNPTSTPAAVSTGYQRQNVKIEALQNGIDLSVVEAGTGKCTVKISGAIDVNGVLYSITQDVDLTLTVAGRYAIHLAGSGDTLTPTLSAADLGTFDPSKNARYTAGGYRVLNWLIDYDGTDSLVFKWLTPHEARNISNDIDTPIETIISASGDWTAPRSKYYTITMTGKGGNGGAAITTNIGNNACAGGASAAATGIVRKYIEAGTVWTATFNTGSGQNTTFSDGVTTLTVQNGAGTIDKTDTISSPIGNAGAVVPTGFDINNGGGDGHHGDYTLVYGGHGGASFWGGGGKGGEAQGSGVGFDAKAYGAGGGGARRSAGTAAGTSAGGAGRQAIIRIQG